MEPFAFERAADPANAVATVAGDPDAAFLAGGTNLVDHMKLGVATPHRLVDVTHLPLDEITELPDGGLRIGAGVRNSDLAAHPLVRRRYPVLAQALLAGASGQLRNAATTAGNLMQRTRCVYFQDTTTPCNKREPGSGCSALEGPFTRYHAILGASDQCVATHPSDMAVAMLALGAVVNVLGVDGERRVAVEQFHRLPGAEPQRDTVLGHGELITSVDLPAPGAATRSRYRKVRDRASYAFALVSVAATLDLDVSDSGAHPTISRARIALGGVAPTPWRATLAEEALGGVGAGEERLAAAAEAELAAAEALPGNEFKIELARATLVATLRDLVAEWDGGRRR